MSIWLLLSVVVAFFGHDTKIGFLGWFLISIIFSPVLGVVGLYLFKKYGQKTDETAPTASETPAPAQA